MISKLTKLQKMADKNKIGIYEFSMELAPALAVHEDSNYYIAMDANKLKTQAEKTVALAHEMGHCKKHAFYNVHNELDIMEHHELKANKWAVPFLVPRGRLLKAINAGMKEVFELAEHFDVTEDFIRLALDIYALDEGFAVAVDKCCRND